MTGLRVGGAAGDQQRQADDDRRAVGVEHDVAMPVPLSLNSAAASSIEALLIAVPSRLVNVTSM